MSIVNVPEVLSQRILAGISLAARLGESGLGVGPRVRDLVQVALLGGASQSLIVLYVATVVCCVFRGASQSRPSIYPAARLSIRLIARLST